MRLSGCEEALVEGFQLRIPVKDGRQCSGIEALPQSLTPALDVSRATPRAAVIVIGSEAGDGGSLFTGETADLRHTHQDGDRGSQPDTVHTDDQIEPIGKVAMLADGGDQLLKLAAQKNFEPVDLPRPELPNTLLAACLTAGLELGDILLDLLDQGQLLGQRRQPRIRRFTDSWLRYATAAAIRPASIVSFLACCSMNVAKARTCTGWNTTTTKPSVRSCQTPPAHSHRSPRGRCARPGAAAARPTSRDGLRELLRPAALACCHRPPRRVLFAVSIPAHTVIILLIFVDPSL